MSKKLTLIAAAGLAAAVLPAVASAQSWGDYNRGYNDRSYNQGYDYNGRASYQGDANFVAMKQHIERELKAGVRYGWLSHDEMQSFVDRYKSITGDDGRGHYDYRRANSDWGRRQLSDLDRQIQDMRNSRR